MYGRLGVGLGLGQGKGRTELSHVGSRWFVYASYECMVFAPIVTHLVGRER